MLRRTAMAKRQIPRLAIAVVQGSMSQVATYGVANVEMSVTGRAATGGCSTWNRIQQGYVHGSRDEMWSRGSLSSTIPSEKYLINCPKTWHR